MTSKFSQGVVLELNDVHDLKYVHFIERMIEENINYQAKKICYESQMFDPHLFANKNGLVIQENEGRYHNSRQITMNSEKIFIKCTSRNSHNEVVFTGEDEVVESYVRQFDQMFSRSGPMIRWVYDDHCSTVDIPLKSRGLISSAYPFIDGCPEEYITEYINSDASILVLIGPPGTGKTSLIKEIIQKSGKSAHVTYDINIMAKEGLFTEFMTSDSMFLIMEDADAFLASRQDGNKMMHRFLNIGDGLVSTKGKKIIFSTNLPNVDDIDEALLRVGRCFDIITSRKLTKEEASEVLSELNLNRTLSESSYTLAELTNLARNHKQEKKTVGFY